MTVYDTSFSIDLSQDITTPKPPSQGEKIDIQFSGLQNW